MKRKDILEDLQQKLDEKPEVYEKMAVGGGIEHGSADSTDETGERESDTRKRVGESLQFTCPRCGEPVQKDYYIKNGEYAPCPHDNCDAIIVHEITHRTIAVDSRSDVPEYPEWSSDGEWLGHQEDGDDDAA